jgi:capsular exopolysaccharide synthesis family protein
MSRFFEQTKKGRDLANPKGTAEDLGSGCVLETIKAEVDSEIPNVPASRFSNARKIHLSFSPEAPVLSKEYVSKGLAGESYGSLRTRLMRLQAKRACQSIVISSALPNEGKTLTAMNLALSYASLRDASVLLVDGDLRTRGLSRLLGQPVGPGLAEVLTGKVPFEGSVLATQFPNLYAVSAGSLGGESPRELYARNNWKDFISWCSGSFKIILVDAPPVLPLADFDLMAAACDGIVLVVKALRTRRDVLQKVASQVDPNKLLGVVYNATEAGNHQSHGRYLGEEPTKEK